MDVNRDNVGENNKLNDNNMDNRYVWSITFRRYFYASISHAFLVSIPI